MFRNTIIVAGSGGQGALRVGQMIAYAAINEGNEATWLPSFAKFQAAIQPGGTLILDSSMVDAPVERTDLRVVRVPADVIAEEEGNSRGANMVLLGAYVAACGGISMDAVCRNIDHSFTGSKAKYAESNKRLARRGYDLVASQGN